MKGLRRMRLKCIRLLCLSAVFLSGLFLAGGQTAYAAEEEYTYTVRLYAGNQGTLTENGIDVHSESAHVAYGADCIEVTGLKYGDTVYIRPQDAAEAADARYHVRGVRRSGRDNSEAEAPTFHVASDRDYVVAYGISGDMVAYRVNYLDMEGNPVMESDTYYGNIGERQYVSSRYVDGYQPQALNMVKTLSTNETENVFDFRYVPVTAGEPGAETEPEAPEGGAETAGTAAGPTAGPEDQTDLPQPEEGTEIPNEDTPLGGDAQADIQDEQVPLGQENLEDLDDNEVPLSALSVEKPGIRLGYLPVYIGIGSAALLTLGAAALYLGRRSRKIAVKPTNKKKDKSAGPGKQL